MPPLTPDLTGQRVAADEDKAAYRGIVKGRSGLKHYAGYVNEEFLPELRGQRGIRIYDEMRKNEPAVAGMIAAISAIIDQTPWDVMPGGEDGSSKSGEDLAAARLAEDSLNAMRRPFDEVLTDVETMFTFGFAPFETCYQYKGGQVLWDDIAYRSQDSIENWLLADNGKIEGFVQRAAPDYRYVEIPEWKMLLFRTSTEKNNPEGISILRPAYKPYYYKRTLEEIEAMGAERDLLGIPVMDAPWGATEGEINDAQRLIEAIKNDDQAGIVNTAIGPNPEQRWKLSLLTGQGSSSKVSFTDRLIQRYTTEIHSVTLSQFLRLGAAGQGGYNLSSDQRDLFQIAIRGWMKRITNPFNRTAIPRLIAMNGQTGKASLVHGRISQLNLQTFTNFLTSGVQNGFLTFGKDDEKWLRKEAEMPELPEGVESAAEQKRMAPPPVPGGVPGADGDTSGLNANPGENQNGIFGPNAQKPGATDVLGGDALKKPVSIEQSKLFTEPIVFHNDGVDDERWFGDWETRIMAELALEPKQFYAGQPRDDHGKFAHGSGKGSALHEVMTDKAVADAIARQRTMTPTHALGGGAQVEYNGKTMTRDEMGHEIEREIFAEHSFKNEGKATIVIGPPAAGKSRYATPKLKERDAMLIDADEVKGRIPEFTKTGGLAGIVHEESSAINKRILANAVERKANFVLPQIGDNPEKLKSTLRNLKAKGYNDVELVLVHSDSNFTTRNAVNRFKKGEEFNGKQINRLVDPRMIAGIGNKPRNNYFDLRKDPEFSWVKFNGAFDNTGFAGTPLHD